MSPNFSVHRPPPPPALAAQSGFSDDFGAWAGQPCVRLDDAGRMVALNDRAAALFGQTKDLVLGTQLGCWSLDERGAAALRVFRPEGAPVSAAEFQAPKVREEADPMSLSLPDALCLAALEANARSQKRPFTVTAAGLPMARVSYHWTRAVRAGLDFLAGLDTGGPAQIEASAVTEAPGWMSLTLKLRLAERTQRPTEFDVSAMDQATAAVHELNGQFELSVDYPAIVVTLCLPVAMATMPE